MTITTATAVHNRGKRCLRTPLDQVLLVSSALPPASRSETTPAPRGVLLAGSVMALIRIHCSLLCLRLWSMPGHVRQHSVGVMHTYCEYSSVRASHSTPIGQVSSVLNVTQLCQFSFLKSLLVQSLRRLARAYAELVWRFHPACWQDGDMKINPYINARV